MKLLEFLEMMTIGDGTSPSRQPGGSYLPDGIHISIDLAGHGELADAELESVKTGIFGMFIRAELPEKGFWDEWRKEHGESDKRYQTRQGERRGEGHER